VQEAELGTSSGGEEREGVERADPDEQQQEEREQRGQSLRVGVRAAGVGNVPLSRGEARPAQFGL
jgi:hypothetical protein